VLLPVLLLLFICVPIAELAVIIQVGREIGLLPTVAILVLDSILGSMLLRSQGRAAWRRFNEAVAGGRVPARETIDGVLVVFGGALLLTPGFLTDAVGLALLIPPSRALVRAFLVRRLAHRMVAAAAAGRAGPGRRSYDVEGTATDAPEGKR
jgi:UPF0716 protein FxsA